MSTEQPTLTEIVAEAETHKPEQTDTRREFEGARYTGGTGQLTRDRQRNCCGRCGTDIRAELGRVVGDNRGVIPACSDCAKPLSGHARFKTHAKAAREWRLDRAKPIPAAIPEVDE